MAQLGSMGASGLSSMGAMTPTEAQQQQPNAVLGSMGGTLSQPPPPVPAPNTPTQGPNGTMSYNTSYITPGTSPVTSVAGGQQYMSNMQDAYYNQATSRLDPQWDQRMAAEQTRLANMGMTMGSSTYNSNMNNLGLQQNDAYSSAMNSAILNSGAEASRMQGMDINAGNFANNAAQQNYLNQLASQNQQNAGINMSNQMGLGYAGLANTLANTTLQNSGQLANTALQGQNQLANTGLVNQGNMAVTGLQGQNTLANTGLQNQGQLANTVQQGQNTLANTGLQNQGNLDVVGMQGQNTLANTGLQNSGQLANTVQQGQNQLANTGMVNQGNVDVTNLQSQSAMQIQDSKNAATLQQLGITTQSAEKIAASNNVTTIQAAEINSRAMASAAQASSAGASAALSAATYQAQLTAGLNAQMIADAEKHNTVVDTIAMQNAAWSTVDHLVSLGMSQSDALSMAGITPPQQTAQTTPSTGYINPGATNTANSGAGATDVGTGITGLVNGAIGAINQPVAPVAPPNTSMGGDYLGTGYTPT